MAVTHFEIFAIEARRYSKTTERHRNIRIDHNSTVTLVTELNSEETSVDFRFTATYQGIGYIKIEGNITYSGDATTLTARWNSKGDMPPEVASEIHTTIMTNCVPESVIIARDMRLPPPIPLPKVNIPSSKRGKSSGIEVA